MAQGGGGGSYERGDPVQVLKATALGECRCPGHEEIRVQKNLEVLRGFEKQVFAVTGLELHFRTVLAHKVEQRAHLLRGLLRPPACLSRAEGSRSASVLSR